MARLKPLHARGPTESVDGARTVSRLSSPRPVRSSTRLSAHQAAAALQAPTSIPSSSQSPGATNDRGKPFPRVLPPRLTPPARLTWPSPARTRSGSLSSTSENARQVDLENDDSYEEGYQDALLEIRCAIRYLRRLHKPRAGKKSANTPTPVEPVDGPWMDVNAPRPRSPTPQANSSPSSVPEETATAMDIWSSDPDQQSPAPHRSMNKSKSRSTSNKNKGKPANRSESISLNMNTGRGGSVGKSKSKSKNKGKDKRVTQTIRGTSKSKTVLSKSELSLLWKRAREETSKCQAVTTGMYINGEVAVGGQKAVTVLRKPPCGRCVKYQRVCLVVDPKRETMTTSAGCGCCVRLGVGCN